jgi:hypothetical protein
MVEHVQNLELYGNLVPAENTRTQNEIPEIETIKPYEKKLPQQVYKITLIWTGLFSE